MTAQNLPGAGKIWDEQKERKGRGKERKGTTAPAKGKKRKRTDQGGIERFWRPKICRVPAKFGTNKRKEKEEE